MACKPTRRLSDSRFLLADLQLNHILKETSQKKKKAALGRLPITLDEAYADVMTRIDRSGEQRRVLALKCLSWLLHARRPLRMAELQEVVAVEDDFTDLDEEDLSDASLIVECCCSLVAYEPRTGTVYFSHYTVFGFLVRNDSILTTVDLAKTCLTYLLFEAFESGPCDHVVGFRSRLERYRCLEYVSQYWETYVRGSGEDDPRVRKVLFQFLASHRKRESMLEVFRNCGFQQTGEYCGGEANLPVLHIIARVGFTSICRSVLTSDDADAELYFTGTGIKSTLPISLLTEMRDITAEDKYGDTALHYAARGGHEEIVIALLERGANVDSRNHNSNTPLHLASFNGQRRVVRALVDWGGDVCLKNAHGFTALHYAASTTHVGVVITLLQAERKSRRLQETKYEEYNDEMQSVPIFLKRIRTQLFLASLHPADHIYATLLGNSLWDAKLLGLAIRFYDVGLHLNPTNSFMTRLEDVYHLAACNSCCKTIIGIRHRCVQCNDFDLCSKCSSNPPSWHAQLLHLLLKIPGDEWGGDIGTAKYEALIKDTRQMAITSFEFAKSG
jgi:hypothetical protein